MSLKEDELVGLADRGEIIAYRIGGSLLRFKAKDIYEYLKRKKAQERKAHARTPIPQSNPSGESYGIKDRVVDFFYFHDFYIIVALVIALLIIIILKF